MSDIATRNALIRCIRKLVEPKLWPSGYVDGEEPDGRLKLWVPARTKTFRNNKVIDCVESLGRDWFSNDGYAHGMCTIKFSDAPCHELARLLEWLMTNPETKDYTKKREET